MALLFRKPLFRYAFAIAAVAIATAAAELIQYLTHGRIPFIAYFPAVIVTALYVGTGPALLAVIPRFGTSVVVIWTVA